MLNRRTFLGAAALGTLGVLGGRAASAGMGPAPSDSITIGYVPIACSSPLLAADAMDAFRRRGLDITLRRFAGWADLWSAYLTGQLHVTHMLSPMTVTPMARPTNLAYTMNTNGQAITVASRLHSEVSGLQDLRGRVIGIPFEYSIHSLLLRDALVAHGVDPVADLELRLLRPADMVAQLEVGGIDGFIGPEPFNQRALATGSGRVLHMTKEFWDRHPCCALAIGEDWQDAHPAQASAITDALAEASAFLNAPGNHAEAASILSHERYLNQPAELIEPVFEGAYRNWAGEDIVDPERIHFGDATDPAATAWMREQLTRWELA
ncbi:ABC transporter substrate-binding protein [Corynebacterium sp. YIM 101645]|uniref:ABC transporter substrate-binding protein n=1 Tax=Corynebacterium lemuris TaxID=1859292 RepID=A0ABT2FX92_9CORY|nr:ABC transporter substrate-binding protein [Corynebacterium lemuris]MCS5479863.1 ABC transporter substrate-binding protein [Corynebacterium lemuris]